MMYVAEIIKVAEARSESSSAFGDPLLTEAAMKLDELLMWTNGAEEALKKKHKLRKYQPQDYRDYLTFEKDLKNRMEQFDELAKHADPEQIKLIKKCFDSIEESKDKWLDHLDQGLPKQLAKVGQFLKEAKEELKFNANEEQLYSLEPDDANESIHSIESKIKSHNEVFENMNSLIGTGELRDKHMFCYVKCNGTIK